jgi:hypothetical protein
MIRILMLAASTLLGASVAAAGNRPFQCTTVGCAEVLHWVCTWAHSWRLAETAGDPEALARKALRRCSSYVAVMARFKTQEELKAYRADILSERVGTINERRAMQVQLRSGKCPDSELNGVGRNRPRRRGDHIRPKVG